MVCMIVSVSESLTPNTRRVMALAPLETPAGNCTTSLAFFRLTGLGVGRNDPNAGICAVDLEITD